jgi:hypothetical protein
VFNEVGRGHGCADYLSFEWSARSKKPEMFPTFVHHKPSTGFTLSKFFAVKILVSGDPSGDQG